MSIDAYNACQIEAYTAFQKVLPHLSASLIKKENRRRLESLREFIPIPFLTNFYGFETSLDPQKTWVDVAFYSPLTAEQMELLDWYWQGDSVPAEINQNKLWNQCFNFLQRASKEKIISDDQIDSLWICYDIASSPNWPPNPNFYLSTSGNQVDEKIIDQLCDALKNEKMSPLQFRTVQSFVNECKISGIRINSIGFMLARDSRHVRIHILGSVFKCVDFIEDFLNRIGYRYNKRTLMDLLYKLPSCLCVTGLLIDFDDVIHPRLGVEVHTAEGPFLDMKNSCKSVLDFLQSEKLTNQCKNSAVFSWLGGDRELLHPSYESTEIALYNYIRSLYHIKFVYIPEKSLKAKAYLGVTPSKNS